MLPVTKESFAKALEALVRKFDSDLQTYSSQGYGEAQARSHFITPIRIQGGVDLFRVRRPPRFGDR